MPYYSRRSVRQAIIYILAVLVLLIMLVPYFWLVMTSFKDRVDIFSSPPKLMFTPTLENYKIAFVEKDFPRNLKNSVIVALVSTSVTLLAGIPAAFSMTRFPLRLNNLFLFFLLSARLLPGIVLAVPLFILFSKMRLANTYTSVIISHITFNLPFAIWMMRGFFAGVPTEIDEAAWIDGCSTTGAFFRVVLPLVRGGLAATAIFCLINSWNEFLLALILTGRNTATLPVAVPGLMTPIGTFWGQIAAVGVVTTLPVIVFALMVQKHMVKGLTGGAIQGT